MNKQETATMLAAMEKDGKGGGKFWTPEDGENPIRIMPPIKANAEVLPYFHHKVHWIDGEPLECIAQTLTDKNGNVHEAQSCPACKKSKQFYKIAEKDSEESEIAYDLSGKNRYVFRILDRNVENPTPEFYEVGPAIYKKFYGIMKSGRYGNIVHPLEGRDFIVDKTGSKRRTNYDNSAADPNVSPILEDKEALKEVLMKIKEMPYNELISFPTAETIQEAVDAYFAEDATVSGKASTSSNEKTEVETKSVVDAEVDEAKGEANVDEIDDILGEFV